MKMLKMIRKNRKKLDNKGFTLIELLAVIVILAIVMGISATSVLNSINQSRVSSLLSAAQNAANTLNTWTSEDALITDTSTMHIGTDSEFYKQVVTNGGGNWICLNDALTIKNAGSTISVLKALSLNGAADGTSGDIIISTDAKKSVVPTKGSATRANCSAVRYNNRLGAYEIFLSANNQGKYYVAKNGDANANFAYSRASKTGEQIGD